MSSSDGDKNLGGKINQDDIDVEQFSITTSALKDGMAAGTSIEIRIYT